VRQALTPVGVHQQRPPLLLAQVVQLLLEHSVKPLARIW
jgi:hypothetical protein